MSTSNGAQNMAKRTTTALISICDEFANGIRSLAAFVEQRDYQTWQYFLGRYTGLAQLPGERDIDCLVQALVEKSPSVVGISVRSFYQGVAQALTSRLREALPDSMIVWGGVHPTISPEECIQYADVVCLGEGEESFLDLLETIEERGRPTAIEGMWVRDGSQMVKGDFRLPLQNLDSIPSLRYGGGNKFLIEEGRVSLYDGIPLGAMTRYGIRKYDAITSRGCRFSCSYCVNSFFRKYYPKGTQVRRRSSEHVLAELRLVKDHVDVIDFQDDDFLFDRNWVREFLPGYTAEIGLPFVCLATPAHMEDEGYLRELRRAGLISVCVGIQSGSERTQRTFHRPFSRERIVQIAQAANRMGLLLQFDVILDNPFETEEDVSKTLDLLLDLPRPFRLNLFSLTFFPNYIITGMAMERGLIAEPGTGYTKLEDERGNYAKNSYLSNLIYLTQVNFFPKSLIRWMARQQWNKSHPAVTKTLVRFMQYTLGSRIPYLVLLVMRNPNTIVRGAWRRLTRSATTSPR
jgi:radical SAM superfamily enzyme YgiQ (UPF0313 family)